MTDSKLTRSSAMPVPLIVSLDSIRTDGWFERIGEGIGSFQALCDIVGPRFFAFAMITGARITSLTVDRRNPDNTLVDFVVGPEGAEVSEADAQRLSLSDFRKRLVSALITEEPISDPPKRVTDLEAFHCTWRPLSAYWRAAVRLRRSVSHGRARRLLVRFSHDGVEEAYLLSAFRARMRAHGAKSSSVDASASTWRLSFLASRSREAAERRRPRAHLELLGPGRRSSRISCARPEGQMLNVETRGLIARALACGGARASCSAKSARRRGAAVWGAIAG